MLKIAPVERKWNAEHHFYCWQSFPESQFYKRKFGLYGGLMFTLLLNWISKSKVNEVHWSQKKLQNSIVCRIRCWWTMLLSINKQLVYFSIYHRVSLFYVFCTRCFHVFANNLLSLYAFPCLASVSYPFACKSRSKSKGKLPFNSFFSIFNCCKLNKCKIRRVDNFQ